LEFQSRSSNRRLHKLKEYDYASISRKKTSLLCSQLYECV